MGPFKVLARTAPNTYRLGVPATWRTCAELHVDRLRPYLRRPDHLGGEAAPRPPVIGADGRPEHEKQELLKFKMRWGRPYVLVRWAGHDASGDAWEPLDNLTICEEAVETKRHYTGRRVTGPETKRHRHTVIRTAALSVTPAPVAWRRVAGESVNLCFGFHVSSESIAARRA